MSITRLRPDPAKDPANAGRSGDALRGTLAKNSGIIGPIELRGLPFSDTESSYIGVRRAEGDNLEYASGTKHGRATAKFSRLMDTNRVARIVFDSPAVGMQTLAFDPEQACRPLSQDVIRPVEQAQIVTNGAESAIRRTWERLTDTGGQFVLFDVRDMDTDGLSHWHVYWCVDQAHVDADSLSARWRRVACTPCARSD